MTRRRSKTTKQATDNLDPRKWGPHGWQFLHAVSFGYPKSPTQQDKQLYKRFFELLRFTLPCGTCRDNFSSHLRDYPIIYYLDSREKLTEWTYLIHNAANQSKKKKSISRAAYKKKYEAMRLFL